MSDEETLTRRLRAVERSLTDGDHDVEALREAGVLADRVESLELQLSEAEDRITELEAATQALRGYVGNVRSVNEDVERRADAALAAVDRLEERTDVTEPEPTPRRSRDRLPDSTRIPPATDRPGDADEGRGFGDGTDDATENASEDASLLRRVRDALG